jgi:excisionase family DNA binding protein
MPSRFLTTQQVADLCEVHENTIYDWIQRGVLTPIRLHPTSKHRFRPEDVDDVRRKLGLLEDVS